MALIHSSLDTVVGQIGASYREAAVNLRAGYRTPGWLSE